MKIGTEFGLIIKFFKGRREEEKLLKSVIKNLTDRLGLMQKPGFLDQIA